MPVSPCPDCGKEVSTLAQACPHCGRPMQAHNVVAPKSGEGLFMQGLNFGCATILTIVGALFVLGVLKSVFG